MTRLWMVAFVCLSCVAYAKDLVESDFVELYQIPNGSAFGQLRFVGLDWDRQGHEQPDTVERFYFEPGVGWIINSPSSQKTVVANEKFQFLSSFPFLWPGYAYQVYFGASERSLYSMGGEGILVVSPNEDKTTYTSFKNTTGDSWLMYFSAFDFFVAKGRNTMGGILNLRAQGVKNSPLLNANQLTNSEETRQLRDQGFRWTDTAVTFRGFDIFSSITDFLRATGWNASKIRAKSGRFDVERYLKSSFEQMSKEQQFLGFDGRENSYWSDKIRFLVFDRNGFLIAVNVVPVAQEWNDFIDWYAVHPSGDLYRLVVKGDRNQPVHVQVFQNTWDPEARKLWEQTKKVPQFVTPLSTGVYAYPFGLWEPARVSSPQVELRREPNESSKLLTKYSKGTPVTILQRLEQLDKTGAWYEVRDWEGRQGWISGAFLEDIGIF